MVAVGSVVVPSNSCIARKASYRHQNLKLYCTLSKMRTLVCKCKRLTSDNVSMIVGILELVRQATEVKPDELRLLVLLQERADGSELFANYGGTHIRIVRIGPSTSEKVLAAQHKSTRQTHQKRQREVTRRYLMTTTCPNTTFKKSRAVTSIMCKKSCSTS